MSSKWLSWSYLGRLAELQDRKIAPTEPKRAIFGAQDSPEIAPERHLRLSWGCLEAIERPRYAQDSIKIAPREDQEGSRELLGLYYAYTHTHTCTARHAHARTHARTHACTHMHAQTHTHDRDTDIYCVSVPLAQCWALAHRFRFKL